MNKSLLTAITCATLALTTFPAAAQNMKPGLWEITNKMGGDQGAKLAAAQDQMQKQMAAMSPEQRKQMEKMMAQHGVAMAPGAAPGGGMASRVCISKEMAARNEPPAQQGNCKNEQFQKSGNTTRFKFSCTQPQSSGEGEYTLHSPESYSMKMKAVTQHKGKSENMSMDATGKWLSNDCGNLKPVKG